MRFLSSEGTFQALHYIVKKLRQLEQRLRWKSKVKRCNFLAIRVCLKSYFAAVLNELQVPFPGKSINKHALLYS